MNSRGWANAAFPIVAIVLAVAYFGSMTSAQNRPDTRAKSPSADWEYKVVDVMTELKFDVEEIAADPMKGKKLLETFLTDQGRGGWELVSYSRTAAVYKRRLAN